MHQHPPAPEVSAVKKRATVGGKGASGSKMTTSTDAKPCRLLELPPELRNRIYHMAAEIEFDVDYEPPLLIKRKASGAGVAACAHGGRNFFSLTQTCKQIRSEYRPLWLRNSALSIKFVDVNKFIDTFYPTVEDYVNAPRLILITWDHEDDEYVDEYDDALLDVTNLLRFRAFCPKFSASFKSRILIEDDLPDIECNLCGHSINCSCDIDCDHEDTIEEVYDNIHEEYEYLRIVNEILSNDCPAWLKYLRKQLTSMTVELLVDLDNDRLTIYIRFEEGTAPFAKKSMFSGATRFLKKHGFLDLEFRADMDFVVGEATGKYTRQLQGCTTLVPTYNQIEIPGTTEYKPKQVADKAAAT